MENAAELRTHDHPLIFPLLVLLLMTASLSEAVLFVSEELPTIYAAPLLTFSVFLAWSLFWAALAVLFSHIVRRLPFPSGRWWHSLLTVAFLMAPALVHAARAASKMRSFKGGIELRQLVLFLALAMLFTILYRLAVSTGRRARALAWGTTLIAFTMMLLLWISRIPPSMDVKVKPDVTAVPPSEARPHIYLVVLDTMRRDVFAPYTADAGRQPVLARFATEGIVFEDAWTPVPYTSGSHASMIFGVYPAHHRVGLDVPGLPANLSSLPLFLRKNGYATGAVSANPHISRFFGYSRHFEFVGEPEKSLDLRPSKKEHTLFNKKLLWIAFRLTARVGMLDPVCRLFNVRQTKIDGSSVVDMATRFVRENRESPIFLLVNFMETHWPYSPSSGQKNNLFPGPGSTWRDLLVKYPKVLRDQQKETAATQAARFTEEEAAILRSLYLERSEYLDVHLGNFFHGLEEMGALDKALVIIVADHGELMGENGLFGHACDLDERLLHVPMILWWSEGLMPDSLRGKRFWPRVSLVDIPHTLVEILAGTEPSMEGWIPSGAFTGRSFREDLSEPDFLLGNAQDGVLPAMIPPDVPFPRGWEKVSQSTPSRDTVPVFSSLGDRVRVIYGNRSAIFEKGQFMGGARSTEKGWEEDEIPPPDEIVRLADLYQEMLRNRGVGAESEDLPEYMKEHLRALGYIQ